MAQSLVSKFGLTYDNWTKGLQNIKFNNLDPRPMGNIDQSFQAYVNGKEMKGSESEYAPTLRKMGVNPLNYLTTGPTGEIQIDFVSLNNNIIDSRKVKQKLFEEHLKKVESILFNVRNFYNNWEVLSQYWSINTKPEEYSPSMRSLINALIASVNFYISGNIKYYQENTSIRADLGSFGTISYSQDEAQDTLIRYFGEMGYELLTQSKMLNPYGHEMNNLEYFVYDFFTPFTDEKLNAKIKDVVTEVWGETIDKNGLANQEMTNLKLTKFPKIDGVTKVGARYNKLTDSYELEPLENTTLAQLVTDNSIGWNVDNQVYATPQEASEAIDSKIELFQLNDTITITHDRDGNSVESVSGNLTISSLPDNTNDLIFVNTIKQGSSNNEVYYTLVRVQKLNDEFKLMRLTQGLGGLITSVEGVWRSLVLPDTSTTETKAFEINVGLDLNTLIQNIRMEFDFLPIQDDFVEAKINPQINGQYVLSNLPMAFERTPDIAWQDGATINTFVENKYTNFTTVPTNIQSANEYSFLANFDISLKPKDTDSQVLEIFFGDIKENPTNSNFTYSYREVNGGVQGLTIVPMTQTQRYKIRLVKVEYLAPSDISKFIAQLVTNNQKLADIEQDNEATRLDNIAFKDNITQEWNEFQTDFNDTKVDKTEFDEFKEDILPIEIEVEADLHSTLVKMRSLALEQGKKYYFYFNQELTLPSGKYKGFNKQSDYIIPAKNQGYFYLDSSFSIAGEFRLIVIVNNIYLSSYLDSSSWKNLDDYNNKSEKYFYLLNDGDNVNKKQVKEALEDVEVDLSNYYDKTEVDTLIDNVEVDNIIYFNTTTNDIMELINQMIDNPTALNEIKDFTLLSNEAIELDKDKYIFENKRTAFFATAGPKGYYSAQGNQVLLSLNNIVVRYIDGDYSWFFENDYNNEKTFGELLNGDQANKKQIEEGVVEGTKLLYTLHTFDKINTLEGLKQIILDNPRPFYSGWINIGDNIILPSENSFVQKPNPDPNIDEPIIENGVYSDYNFLQNFDLDLNYIYFGGNSNIGIRSKNIIGRWIWNETTSSYDFTWTRTDLIPDKTLAELDDNETKITVKQIKDYIDSQINK